MSKERKKCKNCGVYMEEIGDVGKDKQVIEGTRIALETTILYQCLECKTVELH